jgi:hypothetical protein
MTFWSPVDYAVGPTPGPGPTPSPGPGPGPVGQCRASRPRRHAGAAGAEPGGHRRRLERAARAGRRRAPEPRSAAALGFVAAPISEPVPPSASYGTPATHPSRLPPIPSRHLRRPDRRSPQCPFCGIHWPISAVDRGLAADWVYWGTPDPHSARTGGGSGQTGGNLQPHPHLLAHVFQMTSFTGEHSGLREGFAHPAAKNSPEPGYSRTRAPQDARAPRHAQGTCPGGQ